MRAHSAKLSAALLAMMALSARADLVTATNSGNWSVGATWNSGQEPQTNDDVVVGSGKTVTVDVPTAALNSFTNSGSLVFGGWDTALSAAEVVIKGSVSHTTNTCVTAPWVPDRRVYFKCTNFTLSAGATINVDGMGYQGPKSGSYTPGRGPGAAKQGTYGGAGAGHGGAGGNSKLTNGNGYPAGGVTYGDATEPNDPGSTPGQNQSVAAVNGGGVVRVEASGAVVIDGAITAHGQSGGNAQAGAAGGSICIKGRTFAGTGQIRANGGNAGTTGYQVIGAGGGGRVALHFDTTAQGALPAQPQIKLSAAGGTNRQYLNSAWGEAGGVPYPRDKTLRNLDWHWGSGGSGTIYLSGTNFYPRPQLEGGALVIPGFSEWSIESLSVSNGVAAFPAEFRLTVANDLVAGDSGGIELVDARLDVGGDMLLDTEAYGATTLRGGTNASYSVAGDVRISKGWLEFHETSTNSPVLAVGGNLTITNSGALYAFSGATVTNAGAPDYGLKVEVGGGMLIAGKSWVYPYASVTNGAAPLFIAGSLNILKTGGVNGNAKGYRGGWISSKEKGYGPGASGGADYGIGGAGYGGRGGGGTDSSSSSSGGPVYGLAEGPLEPGSGTGRYQDFESCFGGGLVRIQTSGAMKIDGTVSANGEQRGERLGGGSGGGVWLLANVFRGSGRIEASGANATSFGGGGGGGRIVLAYNKAAQAAEPVQPEFALAANGGGNADNDNVARRTSRGSQGTIWLSDNAFYPRGRLEGGNLVIPGFTEWTAPRLDISGGVAGFVNGVKVTVAGDVNVTGAGGLGIDNSEITVGGSLIMDSNATKTACSVWRGGPQFGMAISSNLVVSKGWLEFHGGETNVNELVVGGDLVLTNSAELLVHSGKAPMTNGVDYGVKVGLGGNLKISNGAWVNLYSHKTAEGSPLIEMENLFMAESQGCGFNANGLGYAGTSGYNQWGRGDGASKGAAYAVGGAGHGGAGGKGNFSSDTSAGGPAYGAAERPILAGSSSGQHQGTAGGAGGGVIRLEARRYFYGSGLFTANGVLGASGGAGAGGSIYIRCRHFRGSGAMRARGANGKSSEPGGGGGGGGGRIAIYSTTSDWQGELIATTNSVAGGKGGVGGSYTGDSGGDGTVYFGLIPAPGSVIILR